MKAASIMQRKIPPSAIHSPPPSQLMNGNVIHQKDYDDEEEQHRCRHCLSSASLFTDWAQGDRVCVQCGIIQDERLRETRPEWRSFTEDTTVDPNSNRCGLVPNDETKYWGGLEPTTLSSHVFGGGGTDDRPNHAWRKRLLATQRKIEKMMEQEHSRSMKDAKVAHQIVASRRKRQRQIRRDEDDDDDEEEEELDEYDNTNKYLEDVRPDYEQILLREEEEAQRVHARLYAAKWSLDRALLLHGPDDDTSSSVQQHQVARDELWKQLDKSLRQASADIYQAYTMLTDAAQRLELPNRITREALHMLCRYATQRDGLIVKGVSSRIVSVKAMNTTSSNTKQHARHGDKNDDLAQRLRDYNKLKQIGSLCSALLFLTARNLGWTRSLLEVCDSFQGTLQNAAPATTTTSTKSNHRDNKKRKHAAGAISTTMIEDEGNDNHPSESTITTTTSMSFIKPKHCSKAMNEIKKIFPDFGRSVAAANPTVTTSGAAGALHHVHNMKSSSAQVPVDEEEATSNFLTHALRKLHLPPVAEESVRALVRHCRAEQVTLGRDSGMKLSTLSASMAYFICVAGASMQRLAEQGRSATTTASSSTASSAWMAKANFTIPRKRPATTAAPSPQASTVGRKRRASQLLSDPPEDSNNISTQQSAAAKVLLPQEPAAAEVLPPPQSQQTEQAPVVTESMPTKVIPVIKRRKRDSVPLEDNANLFDDPVEKVDDTLTAPKSSAAPCQGLKDGVDKNKQNNDTQGKNNSEPFDVFSHPAVVASDLSERQAYEMRRMWDTWTEQMPWTRSLGEIENSCGVSKNVILEAYQSKLYPRRMELLKILQESVDKTSSVAQASTAANYSTTTGNRTLASTPLASSLLSHITAAAPLLSRKGKVE